MKNDITYEYRVFTNRRIDVESMEVGICTSKVINDLNAKDKVNGRFFHTSDTDEWFFCWNGELQKLNLKGNSDVNDALAEVEKLIADAKVAVDDAKKTASEAKTAAADAKTAADAAMSAVESIENKADKSVVEELVKSVEDKADKSVVDTLDAKVAAIKVPTKVSAFENDANYLTEHQDISGKQDVIADLATIRANAELGATAIQEIPDTYATKTYVAEQIEGLNIPTVPTDVSEFTNDAGYLTKDVADGYYAALGTTGSGNGVDKNYVDTELAKKQNIIDDIDDIRTKANSALQSIPEDYITSEELEGKGYLTSHQDISGKQDIIGDLETIRSGAAAGATALQAQALDNYYTIEQIDDMIGVAIEKTNTILKA